MQTQLIIDNQPRSGREGKTFERRIVNTLDASGSTLVLVEALEVGGQSGNPSVIAGQPLVYHSRAWHVLGEHSRIK